MSTAVAHDAFQAIRMDGGWRAVCKGCGYRGPVRSHPLDCGPDGVAHERRAAEREAVQATKGTESCVG